MAVYYGVISLLYLLGMAARSSQARVATYWLALIALFLFSAYRYEVGCDWLGYYNNFLIQMGRTADEALLQREPAYWLIIELVQSLGLPYHYLNVFSSLIFFFGLHRLARVQPDPLAFLILSFPILIINMPMSGIRQAMAVGLLCIAFVEFSRSRTGRFVFWTVIAALFHSGAWMFLALAPIVSGTYSRNRLLLGLAAALPLLALAAMTTSAEIAIGRYVDTGVDAAGALYRTGLLFATALLFLVMLRPAWLYRYPRDYKLVMVGSLMMLLPFLLVPISSVIADRIGYFLIPIQLVIFARIPMLVDPRKQGWLGMAPYLVLLVTFVVWTQFSRLFDLCYVPYRMVFLN